MSPESLKKIYDELYHDTDKRFWKLRGDPYYHDDQYVNEFRTFITKHAIPSITPKNLDEMIELSKHIYETNARSTVIDGSYGEHELLLDELEELWKELLKQASEEQREAFRRWFFDQDQESSEFIISDPEETWERISARD